LEIGKGAAVEAKVQSFLDALADLRDTANADAVFGEPTTVEGRTVIPVAKVTYVFGMGVGRGMVPAAADAEEATQDAAEKGGSGAGGGGVMAHPLAVIEVTPEGTWVKPVIDEQKLALAAGLLGAWVVVWLARTLVRIFGQPR
jgi:uncharacterized spore protein YtfJ